MAGYYARIVPPGPIRLTEAQWGRAMVWGTYDELPGSGPEGGGTLIRYVIAAALEDRARERRAEGRPDIAGRLSWLEGQVRDGRPGTKRVWGKLRKDLEVVKARLCSPDGWVYWTDGG